MNKSRIKPVKSGRNIRMSYSRQKEVLEMPNLIEVQKNSYDWFLKKGLKEVFEDISPITDYSGHLSLEFTDFSLREEEAKYSSELLEGCDILKTAHHGSDTSSSPAFLSALGAQTAIISCGTDNDYGHPTEAALNRLSACGIPVYRTDLLGEIIAVSDGKTVTITSASNEAPPASDAASQTAGSYGYVGNSSSKVVHLASCGKLPGETNRVYFETLDEAVAAGYRKHAGCLGN